MICEHRATLSILELLLSCRFSQYEPWNLKFCTSAQTILNTNPNIIMTPAQSNAKSEAELMFEILDFARCHGRKITKNQITPFADKENQTTLQKLLIGEYLSKVEKKGISTFYTLTSKGLNLFEEKRRSQPVSEQSKTQIIEKLTSAISAKIHP